VLGTKNKCPNCGYKGEPKFIDAFGKAGYDPLMDKVRCPECKTEYEVAPPPWYEEKEDNVSNI